MAQQTVVGGVPNKGEAVSPHRIEPGFANALPHYLPLGIFPLILLAAVHGGWWLLPPFLFMSVAGPLDRALGQDGRTMDPAGTPERRLVWHNLPVWTWAVLWPPTLVFGMWQILVANPFAIWEEAILAIILTMEAQAVFVVGHEMVHRRTTWERRFGSSCLPPLHTRSMRPSMSTSTMPRSARPMTSDRPRKERASGGTSRGKSPAT